MIQFFLNDYGSFFSENLLQLVLATKNTTTKNTTLTVGGDSFYLKFWVKLTTLERSRRFSISSFVAAQPYQLAKKV